MPIPVPVSHQSTTVQCRALQEDIDLPVHEWRKAKKAYGRMWGKSCTVTTLICMDYGYLREAEAEEMYEYLLQLENRVKKRKALEMEPSDNRAVLQAKQAVSNVKDFYRPSRSRRPYASGRTVARRDTNATPALTGSPLPTHLLQTPRT